MNIFATKGGRAQRTSLFFKLSPVAAACTMLVTAMSAQAQTSATPTADAPIASVTVTGIRRGIEDAISVKKDSTSIVEAISAEDIGKLPDVSIAESIARLPGRPARGRPRPGDFRARLVAGLLHHPAQRPRTGQHG